MRLHLLHRVTRTAHEADGPLFPRAAIREPWPANWNGGYKIMRPWGSLMSLAAQCEITREITRWNNIRAKPA